MLSIVIAAFVVMQDWTEARSETTTTEFNWTDVEARIEAHRRQVRLCGPLSAVYVLRLWGQPIDRTIFESWLQVSDRRGVPLRQVVDWCQTYEPNSIGVQIADKRRLRQLPVPCILVVNGGQHCLVLRSVQRRAGRAVVWDPSDLRTKELKTSDLEQVWTGSAIIARDTVSTRTLIVAQVAVAVLGLHWWRRIRRSSHQT
jgi:ABC-type bacteriocin/lantibiotic exporter with double-glycine peptidase domain